MAGLGRTTHRLRSFIQDGLEVVPARLTLFFDMPATGQMIWAAWGKAFYLDGGF